MEDDLDLLDSFGGLLLLAALPLTGACALDLSKTIVHRVWVLSLSNVWLGFQVDPKLCLIPLLTVKVGQRDHRLQKTLYHGTRARGPEAIGAGEMQAHYVRMRLETQAAFGPYRVSFPPLGGHVAKSGNPLEKGSAAVFSSSHFLRLKS